MYTNKYQLLAYFREMSQKNLIEIQRKENDYKKQAALINAGIKKLREQMICEMLYNTRINRWGNEMILNSVLMITYVSDIVMLEARNHVWPYEYMAFARRIGELWEVFCREIFHYPIRELTLIQPPMFHEIQDRLTYNTQKYINDLPVDSATKRELQYYYRVPWSIVDSGGVKLDLDLHFMQNGINYNCDFKSGFSSNEKGNTNRLLSVASIYRFIGDNQRTILFVRQKEEQNNHYLQTLKNSPYWEVYCADEAYRKISEFTGFDIRKWLDRNALWVNDISEDLREHLRKSDLLKYLTW